MIRETLTLSALIAAVLLVRAVFKDRVPKRMIYALWLVVLLKLCMPGTLFSLPVLPAEQTAAPVQRAEFPAQTAPVTPNRPHRRYSRKHPRSRSRRNRQTRRRSR